MELKRCLVLSRTCLSSSGPWEALLLRVASVCVLGSIGCESCVEAERSDACSWVIDEL